MDTGERIEAKNNRNHSSLQPLMSGALTGLVS